MNDKFRHFATRISAIVGSPGAFILAATVILVWALSGPIFDFSDTWQLVINTSTTVVTFLIVFLIQNTQNRDARAIHLKLDELIRTVKDARNTLIDPENLSDEEIERLQIEKGIRVNGVAPGPVWTPLIPASFEAEKVAKFGSDAPMGRAAEPEEIAPSFVFLASDDASYFTGQVLHPNGGEIVNG